MLTCALWLPSLPPDFISRATCGAQRTDLLPFTPPIRQPEVIGERKAIDKAAGVSGNDYAECAKFLFSKLQN